MQPGCCEAGMAGQLGILLVTGEGHWVENQMAHCWSR